MQRTMRVRRFFFLIWPLMLSTEALGHGAESMIRSNFESIGLGVAVDEDCPLDEIAARQAADAEFLRARIKMDPSMPISNGGFWLIVDCLDKDSSTIYLYSVRMEWTWKQGGEWPAIQLSGNFGQRSDGADGLKGIIGYVTEKALTKYLRANIE